MSGLDDDVGGAGGRRDLGGLLASLGLPGDATADDARIVHGRLVDYLRTAPDELQGWAEQQVASAASAVRRLEAPPPGADVDELLVDPEPLDADRIAATPARKAGPAKAGRRGGRRAVHPLLVVVLVIALIVGVYFLGGQAPSGTSATGTPSAGAATPSTPALDQARVAELKAKVAANPKDVASMRELGALYSSAGQFGDAAAWQQRILALNPSDVDALLSLGVAQFNGGDSAAAEKNWLKAAQLKPDQALAHFNLGFLYLSRTPPDMAKVELHWQKVIDIDADSDMAKTVSTHLQRIQNPSPSATPSK